MKVVLIIEYCGEGFCGFQRQKNGITVQEEIESSLNIFFKSEAKKKGILKEFNINVVGSGRTDSGVHATGQVVSFDWPDDIDYEPNRFRRSVNGIIKSGVVILQVSLANDNFDARRNCKEKCYQYNFLLRDVKQVLDFNRSWRIGTSVDLNNMIRAAKIFIGEHDFRNFRAIDCNAKSSVRVVLRSELVRIDSEKLIYLIVGKGFLKQMVRIIAGTLVDIGLGKLSVDELKDILENSKSYSRSLAGKTAPAYGLFMRWVKY